jgi:diaminopimelate epimerase
LSKHIPFYKYQGTGNDFILIDQRQTPYLQKENQALIQKMCNRHFGIGADGLILLQQHESADFEMVYFNADGRESTMCGNGGRCIVAFAHHLGVFEEHCTFKAIDGLHEAKVNGHQVELKMMDVSQVERDEDFYFLDTGSPHYVSFHATLAEVDVVPQGRLIRYGAHFQPNGTNVNFVEVTPDGLIVATYERGVEDETLSCGTGVTAAALAYALDNPHLNSVNIQTKGGKLLVRFHPLSDGFNHIWLCGPAEKVFEGTYFC